MGSVTVERAVPLRAGERAVVAGLRTLKASCCVHGALQVIAEKLPLCSVHVTVDQEILGASVLGEQHGQNCHGVYSLQNSLAQSPQN